jgi:cytochrome c biogenesis protein
MGINNIQTRILKKLANLQFAISLLFAIGFIIAIGTIIEQDQSLTFYKESYPETNPLFGFLTWKIITFLNLNKVYSAWWFLSILFLFGASLLSCTFTTQVPSIKSFKLWKFLNRRQYKSLSVTSNLKQGFTNTVAFNCNANMYHFFKQKNKGYAYSGLLGRVAPIIVHGSIIVLLLGSTIGSLGGYTAQEIVPRGELIHIQNLTKYGNISSIPQAISCRINDFWITYTKELKTDQFYSDLSIIDQQGKEVIRKTVFVNEPLNYNDLVFYQTDWDILGLKLKLNQNTVFQMPLKKITKGGRKFWFGSLNLKNNRKQNLTLVVNDLNGKIYLYDSKGVLVQETMLGNFLNLDENVQIQFSDYITSTGLQIKSDPGIFTVYFSFFLLMVSVYVSFFTYSQLWLVESPKSILLGGKSNRAVLFFQEEFRTIVNRSTKILQ